jgi:type I restriction enzyme S subunit
MSLHVNEPSAKYLVGAGYKRTEIGFIPQEWVVMALADIAAIERGKFSARPRNDPRYYGGEFPFIQTGDVTRSSGSITTFTQTLNREGLRVSRLFPEGTLFFTIAANIGDVGIAQFEAACPDSLVAIVPHAGIQKGWLLYELARRKRDFESLASPGAQLNINLEKLRPYLLPVPTEAEQRAIAAALSDVDALIAGLEKLIVKKRDLKQAAMQQLLTGQTLLPGFSGEWEVKRLGELVSLYQPTTISACDFTETGFPVYGANGIVGFYHSANHEISQVTVTCRGSTCGTVNKTVDQCWITGNSMVLNCDENKFLDKDFFYHLMLAQDMTNCITGTGQPQIVRSPLAAFRVQLPIDILEQKAIALIFNDLEKEITALETRLAKTSELKQGMMQELLTGRTRLV